MIGYITSADDYGDVANPQITVIFSEDFYNGFENMPKVVYTYNRNTKKFLQRFKSDDIKVSLSSLFGAVDLLELEEMRHRLAMKVFFRDSFSHSITHVKSEYLEGVWFPSPSLTDGCKEICVNITDVVCSNSPSVLKVSFLCDILNVLCAIGKVDISAPFYNCTNSIFADSSALKLVCDIFGENDFYSTIPSDLKDVLKSLPAFSKGRKYDVSKIQKGFEKVSYEEKDFSGTRHDFAINIKRSCLKNTLAHIKSALYGNMTLSEFIESLNFEIDESVKRFVTLSEFFRISGNLERTEDIRFLTLYELMSAYGFAEKEITLKSNVRKGRERITHINKTKIPRVIYPDIRCI